MILLASPNKKTVDYWQQGLFGFSPVYAVNNTKSLREKIVVTQPQILLLDYSLLQLNENNLIPKLLKLNAKIKIIVIIPLLPDHIEWELYKNGVTGCCRKDSKPEQIKQAIEFAQKGELWIRRTLMNLMTHDLAIATHDKNRIEHAVNNLLKNLTQREYEIAMLIAEGESNKWIARKLTITERTVKAHLTEIFRKLNISDRLKLALIVKDTMTSLSH